jgi:hypothetical protein
MIGRFALIMLAALGVGALIRMVFGPPPPNVRALQRTSHDIDLMQTDSKARSVDRDRRAIDEKAFQILRWETLAELNLKNGHLSESLTTAMHSAIRIPGYVVPLEMNDERVDEFLLVPTMGACIHTPAPAANQMILVRIHQQRSPKREDGPIWVYGKIELARTETEWGGVAYAINAVNYSSFEGGYD